MRDSFDNYKKFIESDPIFVFDTNVYLQPYRLTPDARDQILKAFKDKTDFTFVPYQVYEEFLRHCDKERDSGFGKYIKIRKEINSLVENTKNTTDGIFVKALEFKYPLVGKLKNDLADIIANMKAVYEQYEKDIQPEIDKDKESLRKDETKGYIEQLASEGKVGAIFTQAELLNIYAEGKLRYEHLLPPGFEDSVKDRDDPTRRKKFGDLILWKQVLLHAKITGRDVIFVTRDVKGDWWELEGKDEVPVESRRELIKEFKEITERDFMMVTFNNFIAYNSRINKVDNTLAFIEMNAIDYADEVFQNCEWQEVLDSKMDLTAHFIHSGDLQEYIDDPLSDVDVDSYEGQYRVLEIESVEMVENEVFIQGVFEKNVEISISANSYGRESVHYGSGVCTIQGSFSISFLVVSTEDGGEEDLDENEEIVYDDSSVKINVGGFNVIDCDVERDDDDDDTDGHGDFYEGCIHCSKSAVYQTNSGEGVCDNHLSLYDICSGCGCLFPLHTLSGAKCSECDD
ncbi:PIN domain-containing protein [Paenibacillus oenotherae]|uniref:PIN domain-containing protein n=1 Tax=Paenibacillus oenotherae TaxID=1435645 RepID=A0ABS7D5T4_9BACL|nr:PIN domain-containing protein [Paenibacillus oenotherae]MBW7475270.1 PIN domain-containing protein [Paenibacillus oenotherae]